MPTLNMTKPIWVWLFDYGPHTHPDVWPNGCKVEALPQTHAFAFETEEEALAHPKAMGWSDNHPYILQKTFLQVKVV